ncbi:hypothetical protein PAHAL_7G070100 [Panicum hallii]|jgi:hypothetical protein|uniref:Uncharacterized protein n=1 Tax=Panicum hallii TaxID=206008 RepID=A0A2T8IBC8_9POAL|nr:hypothetical protein PAHAL_7G070100 [Panicum hallii]
MQCIAEKLAGGDLIPVGKHLLTAVYQLLHSYRLLSSSQPIGNTGGPWWFIQLLLNLYTHKAIGQSLLDRTFPLNYKDDGNMRVPYLPS